MDTAELVTLIDSDPRVREALRAAVPDRGVALADLVAENTRRIEATDRQIAELREAMAEGARRSEVNDRQIAELREAMAEGARRSEVNDRQIAELGEAMAEGARRSEVHDRQIAELSAKLDRSIAALEGRLSGMEMEAAYRNYPFGYFGRLLRRARTLTQAELATLLGDAADAGLITDDQADDLALADLIVVGKSGGQATYLVVEVSRTIRSDDVGRASRRAGILSRLGDPVTPVVAGALISQAVSDEAEDGGVAVVLDGRA